MCGIVGTFGQAGADGREARSIVQSMLSVLQHRGPDDSGTWVDGDVALGHTRLSILDTSRRGHQPFVTDDGLGVITFNGEVYNYRELKQLLRAEGVKFHSDTDTEIVLYALHRWGVETAVPRFNGMFAFAYFDKRDRSLWLARDRVGIKPLFISMSQSGLSFASEQKALLAQPGARRDLDRQALSSLLLYERFDSTHTPYEGIRLFLPGTILHYREGQSAWHAFFDLLRDLDTSAVAETSRTFADSAHCFEDGLVRSVERHLVGDVPVATMCSGGLDSGLVTVIAARKLDGLVSYVADIDGMQGEEVRRASLVAKSAGAELRPVRVDRTRFLTNLPDAIKANDQPMFFAQDVAAMLVAEQIQRDGFKVVLTGDGADELFGGYAWYEHEYRRWARLAQRARWIPDNALTRRLGARVPALMPVDLAREQATYRLTAEPIEYVSTSFNIAIAGGMNRTLRQRAIFSRLARLPPAERAFLSRNFEDVYVHLRECLNTLDKMTMRHSVEARVPFLENDLMKLGFALPVDHKYHDGQRKRLVYELGRKLLPKAVVDLPKIGFVIPDGMWRGLETLLLSGRTAELLDWPTTYHGDLAELLSHKPRYLFRLLGFEIWLRVCVDGQPTKSLADELLAAANLS